MLNLIFHQAFSSFFPVFPVFPVVLFAQPQTGVDLSARIKNEPVFCSIIAGERKLTVLGGAC